MSYYANIGDIEVEHEDNVPNGLAYLRDNWGSAEVEGILATTANYDDHMCHFSHNGNNYILLRKSSGHYFLEPND